MNQLTKTTGQAVAQIGEEELANLAAAGIIPKDCPPAQVTIFAHVCNTHGLDPFAGEIHLVTYRGKDGPKYATIVGIHGLEGRAENSGTYAGSDAPKFNVQANGAYQTMAEVAKSGQMPISVQVTVWKIVAGMRVAFTGEVLYKEYAGNTPQWTQRPIHMISKVALAHALRKAFPRITKGLSTQEEVAAITGETVVDLESSQQPNGKAGQSEAISVPDDIITPISNAIAEIMLNLDLTADSKLIDLNELYRNDVKNDVKGSQYATHPEMVKLFRDAKAYIAKEKAEQQAGITDAELDEDGPEYENGDETYGDAEQQ